jgi:hypothetical protein
MTPINYRFFVDFSGGQFGYLRWVNKLDFDQFPVWVRSVISNEFGNTWLARPLYEDDFQEP